MKVIKKYLLIEVKAERMRHDLVPTLTYGEIEGYDEKPDYLYDTEEEAIEAAYKRSKYREYIIVPQILFDIWEE